MEVLVPECQFDRPVWVTAIASLSPSVVIDARDRQGECSTWSGRTPACTEPSRAQTECGWKRGERAALGREDLTSDSGEKGRPCPPLHRRGPRLGRGADADGDGGRGLGPALRGATPRANGGRAKKR